MLTIVFMNLSKTTFNRSLYQDKLPWPEHTNSPPASQLPSNTLRAMGSETMSIDNAVIVGETVADFWCCWKAANGNLRFGTRITAYAQLFGMGYRPTYQYMHDLEPTASAAKWISTDDPADPEVFSVTDGAAGYDFRIEPVSEHTALKVTVITQDAEA